MNFNDLVKLREDHLSKNMEFNNLEENSKNINDIDIILFVKNNNINKSEKFRILELGTKRSRNSNPTHHKNLFDGIDNIEYIMTDYQDGVDVDVVCDLHNINNVFKNEYFDLILSFSTFEHLKYPQLCSHNLMKLLKIGGRIFIQTHQTYPLHGYKYDYYRFSREALKSLFSSKMNFKTISTFFTYNCMIIPHIKLDNWNDVDESYLNVCYFGEKIDITPDQYIYELDYT